MYGTSSNYTSEYHSYEQGHQYDQQQVDPYAVDPSAAYDEYGNVIQGYEQQEATQAAVADGEFFNAGR
jgi:hypothetical protein